MKKKNCISKDFLFVPIQTFLISKVYLFREVDRNSKEPPVEWVLTTFSTKRKRWWWRRSYKELQGRSEQQQTYWSLQGCSVLNLMYNYDTIYQSSPMIKRKLYWSK